MDVIDFAVSCIDLAPYWQDGRVTAETLPEGYGELYEQVKQDVLRTQVRATRTVNAELVGLYWRVGWLILDRQSDEGWGSKVIDRLATDLRRELPAARGWSRSNLSSMRAFAAAWPSGAIVQRSVLGTHRP